MILLQVLTVGTWSHIIAVYPSTRNKLDKILVAFIVLGKNNEVIATHVSLLLNAV